MENTSLYHDGMRQLQDVRETRSLADRLEQVTSEVSLQKKTDYSSKVLRWSSWQPQIPMVIPIAHTRA